MLPAVPPERPNGYDATLPALRLDTPVDEIRYLPPPSEDEIHLRDYWEVLLRYRWTALALFSIVVVSTLLATLLTVPTYKATTLIEIKAEMQKVVAFQDVQVAQADREFYQTQYDLLRSRTLARRVIDRLKLADEPLFNPPDERPGLVSATLGWIRSLLTRPAPADPVEGESRAEQRLVDRLLGGMGVMPRRNSYLVEVSFVSPSSALAAAVANAIAQEYAALALDQRLEAVQSGRTFIERQLGLTKAALERSEEELQAFARANEIITVDTKQNIEYQKLQDLNAALTHAQHERMAKESLYNQVRGDDGAELSKIADNPVIATLTGELAKREAERARLAETFTPEYPKLKRMDAHIQALKAQIRTQQAALAATLRADFEAAGKQEGLLVQALEDQKKIVNDLNQRAIDYKILKREVDTNRTIYNSLLQRLKEVEVTEGIKASNIHVVDPAEVPRSAYRPRPLLNLTLAVMIGALGGIGLAFLQERLDSSVKTPEDVERYLRVSLLGALPQLRDRRTNGRGTDVSPELVVVEEPKSMGAEALRTLRASLFLSTAAGPPQRLLVTSARSQEGKTCLIANLAIVLAQMGKRVVLLDCDFRRPRVHRVFGFDLDVGATSFLTGCMDLNSVIRSTPYGVDVLTSGPIPPNPVELIDSAPMARLLEELCRRYDFVLLDAPPSIGFADVPLLARRGCGVLFVVRAGETPRKLAAQATGYLLRMGVKLLGIVLNDVRPGWPGYYSSYYYSYYSYAGDESESDASDAPNGNGHDLFDTRGAA